MSEWVSEGVADAHETENAFRAQGSGASCALHLCSKLAAAGGPPPLVTIAKSIQSGDWFRCSLNNEAFP